MKTTMKTIAIAVIAMAIFTMGTYAEWFGIGGGKPSGWSIMDDDDLPEVYMDHDYDGRGVAPDMTGDPAGLNERIQQAQEADKINNNNLNTREETIKNVDQYWQARQDANRQYAQAADKKQAQKLNDWQARVKAATKKGLNGTNKILPSTRTASEDHTIRHGTKDPKAGNYVTSGDAIIGFSNILNAGVGSIVTPYNIVNEKNKLLDMPLTVGMESFSNVLYSFRRTVLVLCELFCIINIIIQAFKMMFGVQEIKKVYVDSIWKTVCCMFLLAVYPAAVDGVISIASGMGIHMGNGYTDLNQTFSKAVAVIYEHMTEGMKELQKAIDTAKMQGIDGKMYISQSAIDNMSNSTQTPELVKKLVQDAGLTIVEQKGAGANGETYGGNAYDYVYRDSNGTVTVKQSDSTDDDFGALYSWNLAISEKGTEIAGMGNKKSVMELQLYTTKLYALSQVMDLDPIQLDPKTISGGELAQTIIQNTIDAAMQKRKDAGEIIFKGGNKLWVKPLLAPFLKDKQNNRTTILSPAAMVKTCLVFTDAVTLANSYNAEDVANTGSSKQKPEGADKEYNPGNKWFFPNVKKMVYDLLVLLGMLICVTLVMAEYTITIIEYYLVTSLGVLLIPMMFLDATKEYTKNLLRLFLQYFFKIMVQAATVFFTMSMYLHLAMRSFTSMDMENTSDLSTYVGVLIVGVLICSTTGKIASALLSGQPSLSVGDLAHQAHHMMAAGRMATGAARATGRAVQGATIGHRGNDGKLHGGMLGASRAGFKAASHHSQNTAAKQAGGAAAKAAAMGNFESQATSGMRTDPETGELKHMEGTGYQSASNIGGTNGKGWYSGDDLEKMKNGTAEDKAKYAALQNEAGDRASKGFQRQASSQWWANAAYKAATNGEEKIMDGQKERFTGVGSRTIDQQNRETTGNQMNQMENMGAAGMAYGGGKKGETADRLSFFQKPPEASPLPSNTRTASMEPGSGDRKQGEAGL